MFLHSPIASLPVSSRLRHALYLLYRRLRGGAEVQEACRPRCRRLYARADHDHQQPRPTSRGGRRNICGGKRHSGRVVDLVSLEAARRFDRALAQSQSRSQGSAGGVVSRKGKCAGPTGFLLSQRYGQFFGDPGEDSRGPFACPNANVQNYSLYTPEVSVSFVPDVFGLNRRTVESLKAQEQQARFALAATHITLSSNVAAGAIQEASLRGQIDATNELITINTNMLKILREQYAKGYASELDVAAQESQLAQVVATLPPLLKQLAQQRDLLAVLCGRVSQSGSAEKFELSSLQLPQELPLSLPSKLVEQRPDVRQAEENLHSASALIGVAHCQPAPELYSDRGCRQHGGRLQQYVLGGNGFWDVGAGITQPIFDAGTLKHRERAAKAAYTQADEQYRSTVLTAFQNVADTLHALQQDADGLKAAAAAKDAAAVTLDLAKKQFQAGYASYLGS